MPNDHYHLSQQLGALMVQHSWRVFGIRRRDQPVPVSLIALKFRGAMYPPTPIFTKDFMTLVLPGLLLS